jgi:hypothetical protein
MSREFTSDAYIVRKYIHIFSIIAKKQQHFWRALQSVTSVVERIRRKQSSVGDSCLFVQPTILQDPARS